MVVYSYALRKSNNSLLLGGRGVNESASSGCAPANKHQRFHYCNAPGLALQLLQRSFGRSRGVVVHLRLIAIVAARDSVIKTWQCGVVGPGRQQCSSSSNAAACNQPKSTL